MHSEVLYFCTNCHSLGRNTVIGKEAFNTEGNIDSVLNSLDKIYVSSVPQLFKKAEVTRFGDYKGIMNAKCISCGVEVMDRTKAREALTMISRIATRNILGMHNGTGLRRKTEFSWLRENHYSGQWKWLREYCGGEGAPMFPSGNYMYALSPIYSGDTNISTHWSSILAMPMYTFIVINWPNLISRLKSYLINWTDHYGITNSIGGRDEVVSCVDNAISYLVGIAQESVLPIPLIILDIAKRAVNEHLAYTIRTDDTFSCYGIDTVNIRVSDRCFETYLFNEDYYTKTRRMTNSGNLSQYLLPSLIRDDCIRCMEEDESGYMCDLDSENCGECGANPLIRYDALNSINCW